MRDIFERAAKYNGVVKIGNRGGIRTVFKCKKDEAAYMKSIHDEMLKKCPNPQELIEKTNP